MLPITRKVPVIERCGPDRFPLAELLAQAEPAVLKGLVRDWPLVQAGLRADDDAMGYLKSFYNGRTVGTYFGAPEIAGRLFYNDAVTELNFDVRRTPLDEVLEHIRQHLGDERPPTFYIGSTTIDACLPGLRKENDIAFRDHGFDPLASIWIGNRTLVSCHHDAPNNLACCVVGRRRFTVFPPEQIANLYPGPLDPTPGGQAISMVDFANPDFEKYPRFREAIAAGLVAEMEPGDALFLPSLWWHQVESLSPFNVLINYWWSSSPKFMGTPMNVLHHALMSLRDRPEKEKLAWKAVFEYYVFGPSTRAGEHLPEPARGELGPMDDDTARQIRAMLLNNLNR
ncbi:MAG TPA: cupin-like domain-containing protein [Steroidobacteraceae bacterium]|nr:cupin-like domain-containing protein [Steroidobacteraceae bacterium]